MKIDPKKLQRQNEIIEAWLAADGQGSVEAATGFGKSYIGVLLIQKLNIKSPEYETIVVVPTRYLKGQWEMLVKEHKLKHVEVVVINTVIKGSYKCDFLILDEVHRYAANKFKLVFGNVLYSYSLGLTATMERTDERHDIVEHFCPIIASVGISESRKKKYVSEFSVYNLGLKFPPSRVAEYEALNHRFNFNFATFNHDFNLAMSCLKSDTKIRAIAYQKDLEPDQVKVRAINFMRAMQRRKKMLYESPEKLPAIAALVKKFPVPTIIFTETTAHADQIKEALGDICVSYHSKFTQKQLNTNIAQFKDKRTKVRVLSTAKALDEGFNIEGIELAIIASGNSTVRQAVQRTGRAIRYVDGKEAIIVNLYMNGTKEETWLRQRQKGMPKVYWVTEMEEINYESEKEAAGVNGRRIAL